MPDRQTAGAGDVSTEDRLQELARYILEERERRRWHFPRAVFDEIPWEMLLLLYASESKSLSKAALVNGILVSPKLVDRWTDYLEREGLLRRTRDADGPPALKLTPEGLYSLELYLLDRLQRESNTFGNRPAAATGMPGWAVGLLMFGTAVLSGAMTLLLVAV